MSELQGLWSDGRRSRAVPARLRRAGGGCLEVDGGDAGACQWPFEAVQLSPRLGGTPRILRLPDGGSVEVADSPVLLQWFGNEPSRIEAAADWLERRRSAILGSAFLVLAGTIGFVQFGIPWIAAEAAMHMPPAVERHVSEQVEGLLRRSGVGPSKLPVARQRELQREFKALVAGEPRAAGMRLTLVHAPGIGPNAFTLPDGSIFLTDALVDLAGSDEELLAVLAHEAGHHVYRHGMRQAMESSSVFLLAGILAGDASGSALTVALPAAMLGNHFSRGHEREADAYAFGLLRRHGHPVAAFADVLRRLAQATGEPGGAAAYLSSHPPTPERIQAAEQAARSPNGINALQ